MKHGCAMDIHAVCILVGLGLVYSFWTQSILVRMFDPPVTILNTYFIVYSTTAVGLIRGFYISEFRYFKLWGFVKIFEFVLNMEIASPIAIIVSVFGIVVMIKVLKFYKNLLAESEEARKYEKNVFPLYNSTTN